MSKYKVGDKFIVTVTDTVYLGNRIGYRVDNHLYLPEYCLNQFQRYEPKRGEWIRHENPRYSYDREQGNVNAGVHYTCSECNYISWTYNYCPNCGAKMKGADNE